MDENGTRDDASDDAPSSDGDDRNTIDGVSRSYAGGRRVVVGIYVGLVILAGVLGAILGTIGQDLRPAPLFGVIELAPTPLGLALYGSVTVGTVLGLLLGLVMYVSGRFVDDEDDGIDAT